MTPRPLPCVQRGWTALIEAAAAGHTEVVAQLLEHPQTNVYANPHRRRSSLAEAEANGHVACVELLEAAMASPPKPAR